MFNYKNLCDYEFEILCKDIMQKKLGVPLQIFARGRDGGIDITDDTVSKNVVIQVKHYINSKYSDLISSLKKEVSKVAELKPEKYYVCCALELTPANKTEIFNLFAEYMEGSCNILSLNDIDEYLQDPANMDIVRKHYKLWLESTNILEEIDSRDIFIDCETLLYNIKEEQREFVETLSYRQCIDVLERNRLLMILGMPGTGKTMTTKMLALYYAALGYRIIYTTNGDLQSIKKALSVDKESKEIILLDDCLGQYYFRMKDTQENELMSLIKYVLMHKNKKLIMNSRVTIFQHAKESYIELNSFIDTEKVRLQYIDMDSMTIEDKGRIFKNHLYFRNIPSNYYAQILKNNNYRWIVKHRNYTPRIIEYVTRQNVSSKIAADEYCDFIRRCLDNPTEIWRDEFNNRLKAEDRIFLTSLFSLTDVGVEDKVLRRVFNARITKRTDIDTTRNVWEAVLKRMEGTFVKIIENNGVRQIGAINPSVNDFLKNYLDENEPEVEEIGRNATEYIQIVRGFGPDMADIVRSGDACKYNFARDVEKQIVILSNICELGICMEQYRDIVRTFVEFLPYAFYNTASTFTVVPSLLSEPLVSYYDTRNNLLTEEVEDLLDSMDFDDFCIFEENLKNNGLKLCELVDRDVVIEKLGKAVQDYIDGYDRSESYTNQDTYELFNENMVYNGMYHEVDVDKVVNILADCVRDDIYDDVTDKLAVFPREITDDIDLSRYDIWTDTGEIESYVCDVLADPGDRDYSDFYDGDSSYSGHLDGMDELDFIFAE